MITRTGPIDLVLPSYGIAVAESVHADDFTMSWRSDPYCKLLFIVRGQTHLEVRDCEPMTLRSGDTAAVGSDVAHRLADLEPTTVVVLALSATPPQRSRCAARGLARSATPARSRSTPERRRR